MIRDLACCLIFGLFMFFSGYITHYMITELLKELLKELMKELRRL